MTGDQKIRVVRNLVIIAGFLLLLVWSIPIFRLFEFLIFRNNPAFQNAWISQTVREIWAFGYIRLVFWGTIGVCPLVGLIIAFMHFQAIAKSRIKQASVHTYEIGESKIIVHEKDLSLATPAVMGLVSAEKLEKVHQGIEYGAETAAEIYAKIGRASATRASLISKQGFSDNDSMPPLSTSTPTFRELVEAGEIAPEKQMILGYEHGRPRRGSFLDIYSAAVAGESGSGKTSTMLFLVGGGLLAENVRFLGIDPHYPHPKSLGVQTEPLWKTIPLIEMATNKVHMEDVLDIVERTIENRLKQIDTDTTPVVLVIDELYFLSTTSLASRLFQVMSRISTEGRKCAVYMLACSPVWLAECTGRNTVVRDTLTSAYVHRIKPKQAQYLLQNKAEAEKVTKYVKEAGDVLFCPVGDESVVCKMPYTTEHDMGIVARLLKNFQRGHQPSKTNIAINKYIPIVKSKNVLSGTDAEELFDGMEPPKEPRQNQEHEFLLDTEFLIQRLNDICEQESGEGKSLSKNKWQKRFGDHCGINDNTLKKAMLYGKVSTENLQKIVSGLETWNRCVV